MPRPDDVKGPVFGQLLHCGGRHKQLDRMHAAALAAATFALNIKQVGWAPAVAEHSAQIQGTCLA